MLCEIFSFYFQGPILFEATTCKGPWTLTFVCQRWRETAIGLPELWSRLRLQAVQRRRHDLVMLCIERTGSAPIHFHISNVRQTVLDVIRASAPRLASLEVAGSPNEILRLGTLPTTPILQRLSIRYTTDRMEPRLDSSIPDVVTDCPGLRSLTVLLTYRMPSRVHRMRALPFQWHLLHDMDISLYCDSGGILEVLEPCRGLQMLRLDGCCGAAQWNEAMVPNKSITMPSLTWLALSDFDLSSTLFSHLRCPALNTLMLEDVGGAANILALLQASQCPLQTLEILSTMNLETELHGVDVGWDSVLLCLPVLETLVLSLVADYCLDDIPQFKGEEIAQQPESAQSNNKAAGRKSLPQVKRLVLEYDAEYYRDDDSTELWKTILELVESYWTPDGSLKEVCIRGRFWGAPYHATLPCSNDYRERFETMQSGGLHIHVAPESGGTSIIPRPKSEFRSNVLL